MKVKGLKIIICICMALFLAPFKVYADDYSNATIVGFNVVLDEASTSYNSVQNNNNSYFVYRGIFELDDYYVGSINLTLTVNYGSTFNFTRNVTVNGNSFELTFFINNTGTYASGERPSLYNVTYTINSHNLNKNPNGDGTWLFPIESYTFINQFLKNNVKEVGLKEYGEYIYPVFNIQNGDTFLNTWISDGYYYKLVFMTGGLNLHSLSQVEQYFPSGNLTYQNFKILNRFGVTNPQDFDYLVYVELANNTGANGNFKITANLPISTVRIIPIFAQQNNYEDIVSTEFALRFGLSNSLLDNIQRIADGTTASQSATSSSDSANQQLEQDSNTLFTQENTFKNDMNNAMSNIPQFNVNTGFGGRFMTSATWVRQQYERLVTNTPFQNVITFSLLVGLSMIMLGKIRK